jgi:hypothetical protein
MADSMPASPDTMKARYFFYHCRRQSEFICQQAIKRRRILLDVGFIPLSH